MNNANAQARVAAQRSWKRARQAAGFEEILNIFRSGTHALLAFTDVQRRLRLEHSDFKGLQDIPLDRIRGSVGRHREFTRNFRPRNDALRARWENVDAMTYTKGFPPIKVYKVGGTYFVLDGNHRVSVAVHRGHKTIEAYVWEFETPVGISVNADPVWV